MTAPELPGRLHVVGPLGSGAFATVWLAHDPALDADVAVKVLADNWSRRPEVHARFVEEARLLRRVENDRVVRVYDVGELADGRPYLVMTHAAGGSLASHLEKCGSIEVGSALAVLDQVVEGLSVLHSKGIVHRDVNPHNVLLLEPWVAGSSPRAVLADLGLAKDLGLGSGLTQPAGTGDYRAPEQRELSLEVSPATDTYAVSVLARELLTRAGVSPGRRFGSLAAGLSERPDERPSAPELLTRLRTELSVAQPASQVAPLTWLSGIRRRRLVLALVLAVTLIAGATATSSLWPRTYASTAGGLSVRLDGGWSQIESASIPGVGGASGFTLAKDAARVLLARAPAAPGPDGPEARDVAEQTTHDECLVHQPSTVDVGGWRGRLVSWSRCGATSGRVDEVALTVGDTVVYLQVTAPTGEPDLASVLSGLELAPG
ncbi:hypothetical protein BA895_18935 [Humibacillus sp. DSM 29435]|uniref:serine/threonine-protein kinase n=1 Tax=Humibacillus sp. DSM 29435 TaxID=1869167 RepID=UPI0008725726|nr:serine/threonine-protein kinase [Humibacillus sp. DSM 29435]OFE16402.1 hypothetical protein BA895_18935 [Humibacillus sp. DSM 29435]